MPKKMIASTQASSRMNQTKRLKVKGRASSARAPQR